MACLAAYLGFFMGSHGRPEPRLLLHTLAGCFLVGGGAAALNPYFERDRDARMKRTSGRPLPSGRITPLEALLFGLSISVLGLIYLAAWVNTLAAAVALVMHVSYVFLYTPLKPRTYLSAWIGAVAGSIPPVLGWAGASGTLDPGAGVLFLILFCWQFPHIFAIGWMHRDDYVRGGMRVLADSDPEGKRTWVQMTLFSAAMLAVGTFPYFAGMAGIVYLAVSLLIGICFLAFAATLNTAKKLNENAVHLLFASIVYLPVLIFAMVVNKNP